MDDQNKEEEFNSTEIDVEHYLREVYPDQWEFVSASEVVDCPGVWVKCPLDDGWESPYLRTNLTGDEEYKAAASSNLEQCQGNPGNVKERSHGKTSFKKEVQEDKRITKETLVLGDINCKPTKMLTTEPVRSAPQEKTDEMIAREIREAINDIALGSGALTSRIPAATNESLLKTEKESPVFPKSGVNSQLRKTLVIEQSNLPVRSAPKGKSDEMIAREIEEGLNDIVVGSGAKKSQFPAATSLEIKKESPVFQKSGVNSQLRKMLTTDQSNLPVRSAPHEKSDEMIAREIEEGLNDIVIGSGVLKSQAPAARYESLLKTEKGSPVFPKSGVNSQLRKMLTNEQTNLPVRSAPQGKTDEIIVREIEEGLSDIAVDLGATAKCESLLKTKKEGVVSQQYSLAETYKRDSREQAKNSSQNLKK